MMIIIVNSINSGRIDKKMLKICRLKVFMFIGHFFNLCNIPSLHIQSIFMDTPMEIIIATSNSGKLKEIMDKLSPSGVLVRSMNEFPGYTPPPETGKTFEENSRIKAESLSAYTRIPALADDSGLSVLSLDGRPGVYSARYGGEGLTDTERNILLLEEMKNIDDSKREAFFICSMTLSIPGKEICTTEGVCRGEIIRSLKGVGGFGYDPIFFLPEYKKTMAELNRAKKNIISHRGKALDAMIPHIARLISNA
jgi:XTP/dITP diphosphohydrolase